MMYVIDLDDAYVDANHEASACPTGAGGEGRAVFASQSEAEKVAERFRQDGWRAEVRQMPRY